jgi:hypothetical protein
MSSNVAIHWKTDGNVLDYVNALKRISGYNVESHYKL